MDNQDITVTANTAVAGNSNRLSVTPGSYAIAVAGSGNSISGGTGPNAYNVIGDDNALTAGADTAITQVSGNRNQISTSGTALSATLNGDRFTLTAGLGSLYVKGSMTNSTFLVNNGNTNSNAYVVPGFANVLYNSQGNDTIAISDEAFVLGGGGTDTFAFRAGVNTGNGPRIDDFTVGQDNIAILVNWAGGAGMTDLGLSPMAFLTAAQFEQGAAPTRASTRFTYDPATGRLRFTPSGSGTGESQSVATLPAGLNLQAGNLYIANQYAYGAPTQTQLDGLSAVYSTAVNPEPSAVAPVRFAVTDTTINFASSVERGQVLVNDPNALTAQFIYNGNDVLAIASQTAENVFIKSNSSARVSAIAGGGGNDVLDGGLGSTFLRGGAGRDFFFTDARQSQFVWTTVQDFQPSEVVTLWGFQQGVNSFSLLPSAGAAGNEGVSLESTINGALTRVTLTGKTVDDFNSGRIVVSYGQAANGSYLAINDISA